MVGRDTYKAYSSFNNGLLSELDTLSGKGSIQQQQQQQQQHSCINTKLH